MKGTPHSPKLQYYSNLTIRLFSAISRTLLSGESYPTAEKQSVKFAAWGKRESLWYRDSSHNLKKTVWLLTSSSNVRCPLSVRSLTFHIKNKEVLIEITPCIQNYIFQIWQLNFEPELYGQKKNKKKLSYPVTYFDCGCTILVMCL